jgi:hypothetical protein
MASFLGHNTAWMEGDVHFALACEHCFVFVALVAVCLALNLNWIRQRRESVRGKRAGPSTAIEISEGVFAPGLLWLFGESGVEYINLQSPDESDAQEAQRLFLKHKRHDFRHDSHVDLESQGPSLELVEPFPSRYNPAVARSPVLQHQTRAPLGNVPVERGSCVFPLRGLPDTPASQD